VGGDPMVGGAGDGGTETVGGRPREVLEEGGVVALEREKVAVAAGSGADRGVVLGVELCKGGVDPARGNLNALGADDGDFLESFLEGARESAVETRPEVPATLRVEFRKSGVEQDVRMLDDFGKNPKFHGIVGVIGGEAEADPAPVEAAELAEQDADQRPVDPDRAFRAQAPGEALADLTGERFGEKNKKEAGHGPDTLHTLSPTANHCFAGLPNCRGLEMERPAGDVAQRRAGVLARWTLAWVAGEPDRIPVLRTLARAHA